MADKEPINATDIEWESVGRVAVIRIKGARLNIYRRHIHEKLCRAMLRFLRDDAFHVALLTSAAGQSWSAGDDIREFEEPFGDEPDWSEYLSLIPRDKPVIGAVRGHCLGQGLGYLLRLTDLRLASPDAKFGFPEIKFGVGGAGEGSGLTRAMPQVRARYFALTGEIIDAETAAKTDLVNAIVPDDDLDRQALALAQKIAAHPLDALRAEVSPVARTIGGGNPHGQAALFSIYWQMYEAKLGGSPTKD